MHATAITEMHADLVVRIGIEELLGGEARRGYHEGDLASAGDAVRASFQVVKIVSKDAVVADILAGLKLPSSGR